MDFAKATWFIALALWAVASSRPLTRLSQDPTNPIPLWSTEALQEEFTPIRNPLAAMTIQRDRPGVVFLDENRIVVYEVDSTGKLSSRVSPEISSSFQLHASIFTSDAGLLVSTKDWPTRAHYSSLLATAGGLLVRTGDDLTLVSKSFVEIAKFTLPNLDRCTLSVSATQRTILSNCLSNEQKISRFDVLDGSTLQLKYSWSEAPPLYQAYSVTDSGRVASDLAQRGLIFSKFASRRWDRIVKSTKTCRYLPIILADNWVFNLCQDLSRQKHSTFTLSAVDGKVSMEDQFDVGENCSNGPKISENGQVVALSLNTTKLKTRLFEESIEQHISTHIAVYKLPLKTRVLTINVFPLPKNNYDFSLSPDGSKLAVLNDSRVSVYSVATN